MFKILILTMVTSGVSAPVLAQSVNFGSNESEWARDGECDDRRFTGPGMAPGLDTADVAKDASDCRKALKAGHIRLWIAADARAATQCEAIDFGDNASDWARDSECDDYRFEGRGMSGIVLSDDIARDAADCRTLCDAGMIFLRDY